MRPIHRLIIADLVIVASVLALLTLGIAAGQSLIFTLPATLPAGSTVIFAPPGTQPSPPTTQPIITGTAIVCTNTPGVIYPLEGVFLNCHASSFTDQQLDQATIAWNMGDPGSQYNILRGFNVAHPYAYAGSYTATMTITLLTGQVSVATYPITIAQDTRPLNHIVNGANVTNLPSGTRNLLAPGGTFVGPLAFAGKSHIYVGPDAGSGAAPVVTSSNYVQPVTGNGASASNVVQGIALTTSDQLADGFESAGTCWTFIGCHLLNVQDCFNMNQEPSNVLIENCPDAEVNPYSTTSSDYFAWVGGQEINIYGCTIPNTVNQACIRLDDPNIKDVNISYCDIGKTTPSSNTFKSCITCQWYDYLYIGNTLLTNGPLPIGPLNNSPGANASPNAQAQNTIVDTDTLSNSQLQVKSSAINTMLVNDAILPPNTYGISVTANDTSFTGMDKQVQNLWIENDTVTSTSIYAGFLYLTNGEAQGIVLDGDVLADESLIVGSAQTYFVCNLNNDMDSFTKIVNCTWPATANIVSWANNGVFFDNANSSNNAGCLTRAEWEQVTLSGGGHPTGDKYQ